MLKLENTLVTMKMMQKCQKNRWMARQFKTNNLGENSNIYKLEILLKDNRQNGSVDRKADPSFKLCFSKGDAGGFQDSN